MNPGKIFIVEDDSIISLGVQQMLNSIGCEVVGSANNGNDAIEMVREKKPDAVLMDIHLQGPVDGVEAAIVISDTTQIPIIFTTAFSDDETISRAKLSQPSSYLVKPIQKRDLKIAVELALYTGEMNRQKSELTAARDLESSLNSALADLSTDLVSGSHDLTVFSDHLLEKAKLLTSSSAGYVAVTNTQSGKLEAGTLPEIVNVDPVNRDSGFSFSLDAGEDGLYPDFWGHSLNTQQSFYTNDLAKHPSTIREHSNARSMQSFLSVPILIDGASVAQIALANPDRAYTAWDLQATQRLGDLLLLAIQRQRIEREKFEIRSQLFQAQKLQALGALSSGIAHDFNNFLHHILGYASIGFRKTRENREIQQYFSAIQNSSEKIKELIRQILTFGKVGEQKLRPLQLQPLLQQVFELIRFSIPTTIEIKNNIDAACGPVLADETQIQQVIMNLATNAFHAMEDTGGCLTIVLESVDLSTKECKKLALEPGVYACIRVIDTGPGIHLEWHEKIFDPYFSSKEPEKGSGLGLSVVMGIVKMHNGSIELQSSPGSGAAFSVFIPVCQDDDIETSSALPRFVEKGKERILLVDDEQAVLEVQKDMLEDLGYSVTAVIDSLLALKKFKEAPGNYDLVITDMTMPMLTGDKLTQRVLAVKPAIPVIICTGYSGSIDEAEARKLGASSLLMKPATQTDLSSAIRLALAHGEASAIAAIDDDSPEKKQSQAPPKISILETDQDAIKALSGIPSSILNEMSHCTFALNLKETNECISKIAVLDYGLSRFLTRLLNDFQFEKIQKLITQLNYIKYS